MATRFRCFKENDRMELRRVPDVLTEKIMLYADCPYLLPQKRFSGWKVIPKAGKDSRK